MIAWYALHWAATVPDRTGVEGRGINVRVVKRTEASAQLACGKASMVHVTRLLETALACDCQAPADLLPFVYDELRKLRMRFAEAANAFGRLAGS